MDIAKETVTECYVRVVNRDGETRTCHVVRFPCTIGRVKERDLVIEDPSVSSLHASLSVNAEGQLCLEDLGSTNGIYHHYVQVPQLVITQREEVVLGQVTLVIALTEAGLEATPSVIEMARKATATPQSEMSAAATTASAMASPPAPTAKEETTSKSHKILKFNELSMPSNPLDGSPAATISRLVGSGRGGIVCPHCWHRFAVDEFLFIARHQSLVGDPVLGPEAPIRFMPSRFTPEGNALDAAGMSCPDMACPRCHLRIPQAASEMPPLFLSIVGAPASGKSYFLTSMTWALRSVLPRNFAIAFTDTDAVNNQILNDFEETLYLHLDPNEIVGLRKTGLQGEAHNQVLIDNMLVNLPKPFMFTMMPAEHHPRYQEVKAGMSRTLVLYDNAGEHFEPGMDQADNPTTQHLLHSDTIFFLYDPTKDVRFRRRISGSQDPQMEPKARVQRQEIILTEMINRIKKYSGMKSGGKSARTLLLLVSKYDVWKDLLDMELPESPWQWNSACNTCALDVDLIKNVSFAVRQLLEDVCPEVVATAESFAGEVLYLPNSALGHSPEKQEDSGMIGIRPKDIQPFWVSVPMLYFLYEGGFIPSIPEESRVRHPEAAVNCKLSGDVYFVTLPGRPMPVQVPVFFAGYQLRLPGTDLWFTVPPVKAAPTMAGT